MKFRPQRSHLAESMAEAKDFTTRATFLEHLKAQARTMGLGEITDADVTVEAYIFDARVGWDTHLVAIRGKACGFTDGPLPTPPTGL